MKVLYVASNPNNASDLNLAREITELQRRFLYAAGNQVSFVFLPDLRVEDLPTQLSIIAPDILHIAAHGDEERLSLSNQRGERVELCPEMLNIFLGEQPPRLVYLNACNSTAIAGKMVECGSASMVIGSTAPITNHAARSSAVAFYERILAGFSVARAFSVCEQMLKALSASKATVKLHARPGINPATEILHRVPVIVAEFKNGKPLLAADKHYTCRLGVMGCHPATTQVVFFTDDETFINDDDTYEDDLSLIVRGTPVTGMLWAPTKAFWKAMGDHRLFAICTVAGGGCYAISTTLAEALENRFRFSTLAAVPESIARAVQDLRNQDGAELNPLLWDAKLSTNKKLSRGKTQRKNELAPSLALKTQRR
jgi:hypothetical protein